MDPEGTRPKIFYVSGWDKQIDYYLAKELENPDMRKKSLKPTKSKNKAKRIVGITAPEESGSELIVGNMESAEEKIKRLERELTDARLARDFYNEMINVAEKQININIRKKAGCLPAAGD